MALDFQAILGRLGVAVVVHDAAGAILYANPAACELLGTAPQALLASSIELALSGLKDSEIEVSAEPSRLESGEVEYVVVTFRSISSERVARREAERARDASESLYRSGERELSLERARFKLVMDAFPGVLYEFRGKEGRYRFGLLSGRADEFFGPLAQVALEDATPIIAAMHPDERQAFIDSVLESERNLTPWHFEARLPSADGGWRWARAQSIPTREGDEVVWHGVMLDVTEQRRIAETLRHRQKVEAMGELVAGVAHKFHTKRAVIMPNLDMALDDVAGETRVILSEARHATHSAAELVRQLMRITRRESDASPEVVDMVAIVRDVGALLKRTLGGALSLVVSVPAEPVFARGVASDLNMVLLNLCFNARDALQSKSGAQLAIRLSAQGQELVLEVVDNGVGMTEATLQRLGEPFFTTKGPGAGTGLGIATVYGLVRSLSGRVEVESKLGEGSSFRVRLPVEAAPAHTERAHARLSNTLEGLTVLVIEDEAFVRDALVRQLLSVGAKVEAASDGEGGLTAFRKQRFDAVLLDLNMPGMPGMQVLDGLRQTVPGQPVIVLTGHANPSEQLSAASAVLMKPVTRATLVETIAQSLRGRAQPLLS